MSTLWTPGGEHPVDRDAAPTNDPPVGSVTDVDPLAGLSDDERAQAEAMAAEMAVARQRVLEAPADMVVANHAMGLYELAAIHLSEEDPDLEAARLAVDAMGLLVDNLADRLGEAEATLKDALAQLRMAFVQVSQGEGSASSEPENNDDESAAKETNDDE